MTTALAERPVSVTDEQMELVKRTVANGATADELKLYLYDCQRQGVHPLDKLIHFTKRSGKYTPVTSIDFMRIRAAETLEYAGSDDATFLPGFTGPETPFAATVTVWRLVQGQRCAFTATARWSEYKPESNDFMWRKMPHTMLAKCAEALALRKGFPRQLAGLYAKEEMDQADATPAGLAASPPLQTGHHPSVPNGHGESGHINIETGEERSAPPDGYRYIDWFNLEGGWYHIGFKTNGPDSPMVTYKTKLSTVGDLAAQAYSLGTPVRVQTRPNDRGGEGWLNKVETWKPEPDNLADAMALAADDIPF